MRDGSELIYCPFCEVLLGELRELLQKALPCKNVMIDGFLDKMLRYEGCIYVSVGVRQTQCQHS